MSTLQIKMMFLVGLGAMAFMPGARADEWNQKTVVTFSGPVEVPGQVLQAGTYVFKLANSNSSRNIVQIFNERENQVFATFLAIPDYRMQASDKTIIRFAERPAGSPEAIKGWFYPGRTHGHEFVYPKNEALALAKANHTPVPAMPTELAADTGAVAMDGPQVEAMEVAPLKAEKPTGEEVDLAAVFVLTAPHASLAEPEHEELPAELPETGSTVPLVGLMGLLTLATGLGLRAATARMK